jgi:hypothetical protein
MQIILSGENIAFWGLAGKIWIGASWSYPPYRRRISFVFEKSLQGARERKYFIFLLCLYAFHQYNT